MTHDNSENGRFERGRFLSGKLGSTRRILTGDVVLVDGDPFVHFLDPGGADRSITLPVLTSGDDWRVITHIGTANNLTIKNSSNAIISTLTKGQSAICFGSSSEWVALRGWADLGVFGPAGIGHSSGLVPDPGAVGGLSRFLEDTGNWVTVSTPGIVDAYKQFSDGTTIAVASGLSQFRLRSSDGSVGVAITNDDPTFGDVANFIVVPGAVDHNQLLNYVANRHIDHSAVSIATSEGIQGGGDITTTRNLKLSFSGLGTATPALSDTIAYFQTATHFKTSWSTINTILDHNALLNYSTNRHIDHTTVSIIAGTGLSGGGDISTSRTLNVALGGLTTTSSMASSDLLLLSHSGTSEAITFANFNAALDITTLLNYSGVALRAGGNTFTGLQTLTSGGFYLGGAGAIAPPLNFASNPAFGNGNTWQLINTAASSATIPETAFQSIMTSNVGSANPSTAFKINIFASLFASSGSADAYVANFVGQKSAGFAGLLTGLEININQTSGLVQGAPGTSSASYGMVFTGVAEASHPATAAIWITGTSLWKYGTVITSGVTDTAFSDNSSSLNSFVSSGAHTTGLALLGTYSSTAIQSPGFSVGPNGAISSGFMGVATGIVALAGVISGLVQLQPAGTAGTYNFILPSSAGTSGQPMLSGGGGAAQTYGTLLPPAGGTGFTSYTVGDLLYADTTSTLAKLPDIATGNVLLSGGVGVAPLWGKVTSSQITAAALTKTDDTNVTLTLGGTPSTALVNAASLTLGWSGTLAASRGGTGVSALGTGVATAFGVNVGSAGAFVVFNGALGTPSSGVATNLTGTASGLTAGNVTTNANLTGVVTSSGNATSFAANPVFTSSTGTGLIVTTSGADSLVQFKTTGSSKASRANLDATIGGYTSIWASMSGTEEWRIGGNGGTPNSFEIYTNSVLRAAFGASGSTVLGNAAISTTATDGFLYIPTSAGPPTGVPSSNTGRVPLCYDTVTHQFWIYDSGWKQPKNLVGAAIVTWQ